MRHIGHRGVTIMELLAVVAILGIMSALAFPNVVSMSGQMKAAEDSRALVYTLGELRSEAVRLKTPIEVQFFSNAVKWDIDGDGVADGQVPLDSHSGWSSATPLNFSFNGLGLVPSVAGTQTFTIVNRDSNASFTVNANGHVEIL